MAVIEWQDSFCCGIAAIDHEHREMIETINDLFLEIGDDGPPDVVERYLGDIHALIERHFALEERMMRDAHYGNYTAHKADHDRLLEDIRDIMDGVRLTAGYDVRSDLADRLRPWFEDHFRTLDRDLHTLA